MFHKMFSSFRCQTLKPNQNHITSYLSMLKLFYITKKNNIFWLYVPMRNLILVKVLYSTDDLINGSTNKRLLFLQEIHQHSSFCIFHQQKDMVLIFKVSIKFDNVGMVQKIVDF